MSLAASLKRVSALKRSSRFWKNSTWMRSTTTLRVDIRTTGSVAKRQKLAKRLKVVDAFRRSGIDPAWMIMDVIPVSAAGSASVGSAGRRTVRRVGFE